MFRHGVKYINDPEKRADIPPYDFETGWAEATDLIERVYAPRCVLYYLGPLGADTLARILHCVSNQVHARAGAARRRVTLKILRDEREGLGEVFVSAAQGRGRELGDPLGRYGEIAYPGQFERVFHGTKYGIVQSICRHGLSRRGCEPRHRGRGRSYICCCVVPPGALWISSGWRSGSNVAVCLDMGKLLKVGAIIYEPMNNALVTRGPRYSGFVPAKYLYFVERLNAKRERLYDAEEGDDSDFSRRWKDPPAGRGPCDERLSFNAQDDPWRVMQDADGPSFRADLIPSGATDMPP